jgi:hypothetical protein
VHAFDYVIVLLSFVYAAAVTHVLATLGDLITAGRRVRFSAFNLGWMMFTLASILAWWMATWELRAMKAWDPPFIFFNFAMAGALYVIVRLVCPRVAPEGEIDLPAFHREQGRKYLIASTVFGSVGMAYNAAYDLASNGSYFLRADIAVAPMVAAGAVAAIFINRPRVQAACLVVVFAAWGIYFATFQSPLVG